MRRVITTLALVLVLADCGGRDSVKLASHNLVETGCYLTYGELRVVADPTYGTAVEQSVGNPPEIKIEPLLWPEGYTARRQAGGEIEVLDPHGKVVAITGQVSRFNDPAFGDPPGAESSFVTIDGVEVRRVGRCVELMPGLTSPLRERQ